MHVILIMAESIGLIVGSLAAAVLTCWLLWSTFKIVHHPEWGPPIVMVTALVSLIVCRTTSEFAKMTLIFGWLTIIPFWFEGRAWQASIALPKETQDAGKFSLAAPRNGAPSSSYYRYPVIAGCICEARRPEPAELKTVAARVLTEMFGRSQKPPTFARRRTALRLVKAALVGAG